MKRMGFSEVWIDFVYRAVSNVWYSVIMNMGKEGFFTFSRGLRQGGPAISQPLHSCCRDHFYLPNLSPSGQERSSVLAAPMHSSFHHLAYTDDVVIFTMGRCGAVRAPWYACSRTMRRYLVKWRVSRRAHFICIHVPPPKSFAGFETLLGAFIALSPLPTLAALSTLAGRSAYTSPSWIR